MEYAWHLYLMATIYIFAGLNHFRKPKMYERIIPPYLPNAKFLNLASGVAEIVFGTALLIPNFSKWGAWGIVLLLIAFFSVHIYMLQDKKASFGLPRWLLWLRIPIQFLLILWAFHYT